MNTCVFIHVCIFTYICVCVCTYAYVCAYICGIQRTTLGKGDSLTCVCVCVCCCVRAYVCVSARTVRRGSRRKVSLRLGRSTPLIGARCVCVPVCVAVCVAVHCSVLQCHFGQGGGLREAHHLQCVLLCVAVNSYVNWGQGASMPWICARCVCVAVCVDVDCSVCSSALQCRFGGWEECVMNWRDIHTFMKSYMHTNNNYMNTFYFHTCIGGKCRTAL